uniref:Retrotransposon gag domain-containing protein n=1 Tax=Cacopsylla melanoneura TaxID=428564 RepID=A0A8D8RV59_9HEMI
MSTPNGNGQSPATTSRQNLEGQNVENPFSLLGTAVPPAANATKRDVTITTGIVLARLEKEQVHYLKEDELNFEIRLRSGKPRGSIPIRKRQLKLLLDRVRAGLIKIRDRSSEVDPCEFRLVEAAVEEFDEEVRGFTGRQSTFLFRQLKVRIQHWLNRVSYWKASSHIIYEKQRMTMLKFATLLQRLELHAREWEEGEENGGEAEEDREETAAAQNVGESEELFSRSPVIPAGNLLDLESPVGTLSGHGRASRPSISFAPRPRSSSLLPPNPSRSEQTLQTAAYPSYQSINRSSERPRVQHLKTHHWNLKFSGAGDSLTARSFLERLALKARVYDVSWNDMLQNISELLDGVAFSWYLSRSEEFGEWRDFEVAFLEAFENGGGRAQLLQEIANTRQQKDETVTSYMSRLRLLLLRSPERLSGEVQVELAIQGALDKYRDLLSVSQLRNLNEVETRLKQMESVRVNRYEPEDTPVSEPKWSEKKGNQGTKDFKPNYKRKTPYYQQPSSFQSTYYPHYQAQQSFAQPFAYSQPPPPVVAQPAPPFSTQPQLSQPSVNQQPQSFFPPTVRPPEVAPVNDRAQRRHCWGCGRPGFTVRTCGCQSGNANGRS